jgi:hypothetical protein
VELEAMFQSMLHKEVLGGKVQAQVFIDKTGTIFLVNESQGWFKDQTYQVRHPYVRELQERREVKVEFNPTA